MSCLDKTKTPTVITSLINSFSGYPAPNVSQIPMSFLCDLFNQFYNATLLKN